MQDHRALYSLILPRDASPTASAVLASQGLSYHTRCTEVLLVINVVLQQVVNRLLRLSAAAAFGDVAGVCRHGHEIEVCSEAVKHRECNVEEEISVQGGCV